MLLNSNFTKFKAGDFHGSSCGKEKYLCTYEKLQIRDSFMFGKVMENPENCEALLEALLLEKIEVIDCPQREKFIQMKKDGKFIWSILERPV